MRIQVSCECAERFFRWIVQAPLDTADLRLTDAGHLSELLLGPTASHRVDDRRVPLLGRLGYRRTIEIHRRYPADPEDLGRRLHGRTAPPPSHDHHDCAAEECPTSSRDQVLRNWATASHVWFRIVTSCNLSQLEDRAAGYSDVFHSLGAARLSLVLAPAVALGVRTYDHQTGDRAAEVGVIAVMGLVSILILKAFNSARRSTLHSLIDTYRNAITALSPTVFK